MEIKSHLKFLVKIRIVGPLRSFFLFCFKSPVNQENWENRLLIVNLEALGDLLVLTSVLKHYKKRFPDKKIYLLAKDNLGLDHIFKRGLVDEILAINYRRFAVDPFYGVGLINQLRRIGFARVINQDFSAAEVLGKIISISLGAKDVAGYEGMGLEFRIPFNIQQRKTIRYVVGNILPRYTKLIRQIDRGRPTDNRLPSAVSHYVAIYEGATGFREDDYGTTIELSPENQKAGAVLLEKCKLLNKKYAILSFGASVAYKRWPVSDFAEAAKIFKEKGVVVVLTGSAKESGLASQFVDTYGGGSLDLTGKTSLAELAALIKEALLVFTNDSAAAHLAVALKTPSLCITGGGQFGMFADYGHAEINRWVYRETACFGDNWHCGKDARDGEPSPCVSRISVDDVKKELLRLLADLQNNNGKPTSKFSIGSLPEDQVSGSEKPKLTIVYAGTESENYNPKRRPSFEYSNFYLSLKNLPGVRVLEYPFDSIVTLGKKKFNQDLLRFIREAKPDLFFAFMFSDELATSTLDEIKKITKSVSWFADDHWRLWNYSRHYAPHFTWAVTTWSRAPRAYASYGIRNVIRSQWACNTNNWQPVDLKRDIDVSFVGQRNSSRAKIVGSLRKAGVNIWVRGIGWPEGRLAQGEVVKTFSRSKINLNFNTPPSRLSPKLIGRIFFRRSLGRIVFDLWNIKDNFISWWNMKIPQIKARPFEILGCRTFLISARADDMETYYVDGKEAVYCDGTIADLVLKINHYLSNEKEREAIARAGYERTIREHTYAKRFGELFKAIGLNYESR